MTLICLLALHTAQVVAAAPGDCRLVAAGAQVLQSKALSADGKVSCATCHDPGKAFADGLATAKGLEQRQGRRNTPSLLDVAHQKSFFWDGRRPTLEAQALDPVLHPDEHGLRDLAEVMQKLRQDSALAGAVAAAHGTSVDRLEPVHVEKALAAFESTLRSGPTPFDEFRAGAATAMSESARRGWELFKGRADCARCHPADGSRPLFTDNGFHSLGVGLPGGRLPELVSLARRLWAQGKDAGDLLLANADLGALGRFLVTREPKDIGAFKTPGLRNVALTAPYMHDGSVATLEDAVDLELYYRGANKGAPLVLSMGERADLVVFLQALTSQPLLNPQRPCAHVEVRGETRAEVVAGRP
jgi:cytochrome c peroxidase